MPSDAIPFDASILISYTPSLKLNTSSSNTLHVNVRGALNEPFSRPNN